MGILTRFPFGSMLGRPFADYLNISTPVEQSDSLRESVLPVLDPLGNFEEVSPGLFQFYGIGVVKGKITPYKAGTVVFGRRGKVATLSTSGGVLTLLRSKALLGDYLASIAVLPHRVTMLHVTADYHVPDAPAAVQSVKDAAYAGLLSLTRKRISPQQCKHIFSVDVDGKETGTIYLGQRANADVWAKVYDKRHERLSRGFPEPGSIARVELACMSDVGATLRDASDPFDLFFQYAGRSLVEAPPEFAGWQAHGEGYVCGARVERTLFERMDNLISGSLDIGRLADMCVAVYGHEVAAQAIGRRLVALADSRAYIASLKCA